MPPLASPPELLTMPGVDADAYSDVTISTVLDQATSYVISELGWDPRAGERTYRLRTMAYGVPVYLPALNVTAVEATVDDVILDVLDTWWWPHGEVNLDTAVSTTGVVTYTAGWTQDEMPQAIKDACLAIAARLLNNPTRLKAYTVDDVSETYADETGENPLSDPRLNAYRIMALA